MKKLIFLLAFTSIFLSCKNKKNLSETNTDSSNQKQEEQGSKPEESAAMVIDPMNYPENSLAGIRRTYCFGKCPVYSLYLLDDFTLVYNGISNVSKIGNYTAQGTEEDYNNLLNFASQVNYFGLEDEYLAEISDLPTVYTTLVKGNERKTIVDLFMAPESLHEFQAYIDKLFEDKNWQKTED